jgi:hypothetical protein
MKLNLAQLRQKVGALPTVKPEAIVCHWTGGADECSDEDREHYHLIVDQKSAIHRGDHSIADNVPPLRSGKYAAHCLSFNGRNGKPVIGVSVTGMGGDGVGESPFTWGKYPITADQMETFTYLVAYLCITYDLPVTPMTVLMHGEVQKNRGITQRGKWDICRLPYAPKKGPNQVCAEFRAGVEAAIRELRGLDKKRARLFLSLDGRAAISVPSALLVGGTWTAPATSIKPILGAEFVAPPSTEESVAPVRTHLERSGYAIDEAKTAAHQFLSDAADPRQMIVAAKAKARAKTDG